MCFVPLIDDSKVVAQTGESDSGLRNWNKSGIPVAGQEKNWLPLLKCLKKDSQEAYCIRETLIEKLKAELKLIVRDRFCKTLVVGIQII